MPSSTSPPAAPAIDFVAPLSAEEQRTSPDFFKVLAFALGFCPTDPPEVALRDRFTAGIRANGEKGFFHPDRLTFGQPIHASHVIEAAASGAAVAASTYWTNVPS